MEKKKDQARKLKLHRETLRTLTGDELRDAQGGVTGTCQTGSFCHICTTQQHSVCVGCN